MSSPTQFLVNDTAWTRAVANDVHNAAEHFFSCEKEDMVEAYNDLAEKMEDLKELALRKLDAEVKRF